MNNTNNNLTSPPEPTNLRSQYVRNGTVSRKNLQVPKSKDGDQDLKYFLIDRVFSDSELQEEISNFVKTTLQEDYSKIRSDLESLVPKIQPPTQKLTPTTEGFNDFKVKKFLDQEFPGIPTFRWDFSDDGKSISYNITKKDTTSYMWEINPNPTVDTLLKLVNAGKLYRSCNEVNTLSCFLLTNYANQEVLNVANGCKIKIVNI